AWNKGISYGLFQLDGPLWRAALLVLTAVAVVLLSIWLAPGGSPPTPPSPWPIIGGALGHALDRPPHQPGLHFVLFHITTETINFNWYVFNLADAAIVAGVAGLLYDAGWGSRAAKAPRSPT